jgi:hypothetical protein
MKRSVRSAAALLVFLLAACSNRGFPFSLFASPTPIPTAAAIPTHTLTSTRTHTRIPTQSSTRMPTWTFRPTFTPSTTLTASLTPSLTRSPTPVRYVLDRSMENPHGYSFRYHSGWGMDPRQYLDGGVILFGPGMMLIEIGVGNCRSDPCVQDSPDGLALAIGGKQGLRLDCSQGEGLCLEASIPLGDGRFFYLQVQSQGDAGQNEVQSAFQAIAGSVRFFPPHVTPCDFAPDETYGLTPENPIRIGGGAGGYERIEDFMFALAGAGGMELLLYEWTGRLVQDGRTLDVYVVKYSYELPDAYGPEATFYFDRFSYERPLAPYGFPCTASYFPFGEP